MSADDEVRTGLLTCLQEGRDVLLVKLDGLSEYDLRRPLTPTGTNLLGLVKHLTFVELGYFGAVFGRPSPVAQRWVDDDGDPNWDMWATADELSAEVVQGYRTAWAYAGETMDGLSLDAVGRVPWWSRPEVTLHRVLVHVIAETHRHAGHADIVRELIDGSVGNQGVGDNLPDRDGAWWREYREKLEGVARAAGP